MATTNAKAPLRERRTIDVVPDAMRASVQGLDAARWR